jgi:hypothetical protein
MNVTFVNDAILCIMGRFNCVKMLMYPVGCDQFLAFRFNGNHEFYVPIANDCIFHRESHVSLSTGTKISDHETFSVTLVKCRICSNSTITDEPVDVPWIAEFAFSVNPCLINLPLYIVMDGSVIESVVFDEMVLSVLYRSARTDIKYIREVMLTDDDCDVNHGFTSRFKLSNGAYAFICDKS